MIKLLKHLTKREWRFAFCVLVLIVAQVWLDLKMPDYMNAITQIASGSSGIQGRVSGQMSDIWKNGGYMLLCALGSMACSIMTSWFVVNIAANYSARLRETLYTKVQRFSMAEINRFSTASLITRSTNDVQQVHTILILKTHQVSTVCK